MRPSRIVLGLILVGLGVVFLLDQAGTIDAGNVIGDWWPVAIIALGVIQLFDRPRSVLGPGIVIAAGVLLLLFQLDLVEGSVWNVVWPSVLVLLGLVILVRQGRRSGRAAAGTGDMVRSSAVFGGDNIVSRSQGFRGGSVTAIFGGATVDLRRANLAPEGADLDVTAAFGGVEILVPRGWKVALSGTPIFGGYDDKTEADVPPTPDAPELRMDAFVLFGGVDVKHHR